MKDDKDVEELLKEFEPARQSANYQLRSTLSRKPRLNDRRILGHLPDLDKYDSEVSMKRVLFPLFFALICLLPGQQFSHASSRKILSSAKCAASTLYSGKQLTCTATLNKSATGAQFVVDSFSGPLSLVTPAPQLVFTGTTGTFTVLAGSVTKNTAASFTVSAYRKSIVVKLTVQPSGLTYSLTASPSSVAFGNVTVGQAASKTVTLASTGTGTVDITGVTMPVPVFSITGLTGLTTLASGASATFTAGFKPTIAGAETGSLVITSNGSPVSISMSGTGVAAATAALSAVSCSSGTLTGAGTDACTVTLTSAATSATTVSLTSSSSAVTVLTSVSIAAGATSAAFTATASAVSTAQTVTLTATAGGISKTFALTLAPGSKGGAYSLPNDNTGCPGNCRVIPWQTGSDLWNGGTLPVYPSVTCTGLAGNGTTDDGPAIQACINKAAANTAVYIPAGTYLVNSIVTLKSNVVLRGAKAEGGPPFMPAADAAATTIRLGSNESITTQDFSASSGSLTPATKYGVKSPGYTIANAPRKGDTTFTIGSGSLKAGQWVSLFADNDPTLVSSTGTDGACPWCGENTGYDVQVQIDQVTSVSGTTATLARPFYYTLYTNPEYRIYTYPTQEAGFEDLRLDGSHADIGGTQIILLQGCLYCWVKSVETYMTGSNSGSAHVEMDYSYGDEIRDSAFHDGRSSASGDNYGVYFQFTNSDHKVENNVLFHNRHALVFQGGGAGIAVLYNYIDDLYTDDLTFLGSARTSHGAHPFMNLWEGNIASHVTADDFSGTSSHTVFFRNWLWGGESNTIFAGGTGIPSFPPDSGYDAVDLYTGQNYYSFVDNVLGNPNLAAGGGTNADWTAGILTIDCTTNNCGYEGPSAPGVYSMGGALGSTPASSSTVILQGNYDYKTLGVALGTGATYQPSYYYSTKPSFMGSCPFPAQGSDLSPVDTLQQSAYQRAMGSACQVAGRRVRK